MTRSVSCSRERRAGTRKAAKKQERRCWLRKTTAHAEQTNAERRRPSSALRLNRSADTSRSLLQWGTYWWHSHNGDQYMDGLRAPLVIHAPNEVHEYDDEFTVILGDVSCILLAFRSIEKLG